MGTGTPAAAPAKVRPVLERWLVDLNAGAVDALVWLDADRWHRRPIELERFFEIADAAGLHQIATVGGDIDLASGDGPPPTQDRSPTPHIRRDRRLQRGPS